MIWLTWRQFRAQTWFAAAWTGLLCVVLVFFGFQIADLYNGSGAADCVTDCETVIGNFRQQIASGVIPGAVSLATAVMYLTPALIGAFWGAPLVARELEAGTHLLAWNQSVTRTRWLTTKLAFIGGTAVAVMAALSLAGQWFARYIDSVQMDRIQPVVFGSRGIVPVAYAIFALAVGVAAGVLIRRTVPAMAVTLTVYTTAIVVMPVWIRAHLLPLTTTVRPLDTENLYGLMLNTTTADIRVLGNEDVPGAWIVGNETVTPAGLRFAGPANLQYCDGGASGRCVDWLATLNLRQSLTYQPAEHFWPLQIVESGIFVGLAAVLAGICLYQVRRRLA